MFGILNEWYMVLWDEHFSCGTGGWVAEGFLRDNLVECSVSHNQFCILLVNK